MQRQGCDGCSRSLVPVFLVGYPRAEPGHLWDKCLLGQEPPGVTDVPLGLGFCVWPGAQAQNLKAPWKLGCLHEGAKAPAAGGGGCWRGAC